ncbi:MAG: ATP-binding cassette domain-containing protein [Enterococcus sp.]
MITFENVCFHFKNKPIFENLTVHIPSQKFTLLTGDSGAGKSTLLRLIAGFSTIKYSGTIAINQQDIQNMSIKQKVQQVGMMFQVPNKQFTMRTLRQEIIFTLENLQFEPMEIERRIEQATFFVGTQLFLDRSIQELSGGEKQKAALTVLLAVDAPILLLDEPFASVDRASRLELIELLVKLKNNGKTILLIDHEFMGYQTAIDNWLELKANRQLIYRSTMELASEQQTNSLGKKGANTNKILQFQHVSYARNQSKLLLQSSDFYFKRGITTLTGDNGVGKSTLLRSIAQRQSYKGKMFYENRRLRPNRKLYERISLVVQDAQKQFVTTTIKDELHWGKITKEKRERQYEALSYFGLNDKQHLYHLSEGQKKIVQLISMLGMDLHLLMLDEPFSGLDSKACHYFVRWIAQQAQFQDFLIVTHRTHPLDGISEHHVHLANQKLRYIT